MNDKRLLVLEHVPYLRRHARLLCGSQAIGDEYVRVCLELLTEEPERLEGDDLRVQLFKAFHVIWRSVNETLTKAAPVASIDLGERVEAGLSALPGLERHAILLAVVERFTHDQAAEVLGLEADQLRELVTRGRQSLQAQVSANVLVIEDEPVIAEDLARIVEEMGHHVVGTASREDRAVDLARQLKPGLVLADIKLAEEGDGVVAAQTILHNLDVPIVFVTGYPERLLTGHGLEPAFVVSKPFLTETLKVTVAQSLATYASPASASAHRDGLLAKLREITGKNLVGGPPDHWQMAG